MKIKTFNKDSNYPPVFAENITKIIINNYYRIEEHEGGFEITKVGTKNNVFCISLYTGNCIRIK